VSSPVHSPVSGRVIATEPRSHPVMPNDVPAIVIENDKKDTLDDSCVPKVDIEKLSSDEIIEIVRDKGLVGMGGAMFPTHVKIKPTKPLDLLILNGCECEPYLTADHRMMLEHTKEIVGGMRLIAKASGVDKCIIAVEDNKPDAAEALKKFEGDGVTVEVLKTKYPQGAERMLVYRLTGRTVPRGGLPLDVGVVVSNVGTAYAVYDAAANGMPLIKRAITISGDGVKKPGNYMVRIGTPFIDLVKSYIGAKPEDLIDNKMIKMGGRMMGIRQSSLNGSVVKGTSGITIYPLPDIEIDESRQCIRCGRCLSVCPMELNPHLLWYYTNKKDAGALKKLGAQDCIECGCCEYICSAKLPLVPLFKNAKLIVREASAG
jgi:electron transport complex protein RnfC